MNFLKVFVLISVCSKAFATEDSNEDSINSNVCGLRLQRIVGGHEADPRSWPWMVSLQYNFEHVCGGTIVNEQFILTAAHCVVRYKSPSAYKIVIGGNNYTATNTDILKRSIAKITRYPEYISDETYHDIALLKLTEPIQFGVNLLPICLPFKEDKFVDYYCYTTGWGKTHEDGEIQNELREVEVPVLNSTECETKYYYARNDIQYCAGVAGGKLDSCQGDSGGPLVCRKSNYRWYLAGIVSNGYGCGDGGIYAKVSAYRHWIDETIKKYTLEEQTQTQSINFG